MINYDKSEIAFSAGIEASRAEELATRLGARRVPKHGIYLGMPCIVGRSKKELFQMLEDRVRKKLKDWKRRFLSTAGKLLLIKSVAQAIPTYLMSLFLLPEQTCRRINSLTSSFLWGQKHDERRIHWCSWKKICRSKRQGGLGFRDLTEFNKAMLAKQAWRILHGGDSLVGRTLKAKYFPRTSFMDAKNAYNPSFTWRSIMAGKEILEQGTIWRVGNGQHIRIWKDKWLPLLPGHRIFQADNVVLNDLTVCELFSEGGSRWDFDTLTELFTADIREQIMSIPLPRHLGADKIIWKHTTNGIYSVKSGYVVACQLRDLRLSESSSSSDESPLWKWINEIQVAPKIRFFLWKCCKGIVPVAAELKKKNINCDIFCRRCGSEMETSEHALRDCAWSNFLWKVSPLRMHVGTVDRRLLIRQWTEKVAGIPNDKVHVLFATILWVIWRKRNMLVFENKDVPHEACLREIECLVADSMQERSIVSVDTSESEEQWSKPPPGFLKVNVDAAVADGRIGLGVVIRDSKGKVLVSRCCGFQSTVPATIAEGLACQEGLNLAHGFNGYKIIVETDCKILHQKLLSDSPDFSSVGEVVRSIHVDSNHCDTVIYSWARRTANCLAHLLARLAISDSCFIDYTGDVPGSIASNVPRLERLNF